jgi:hypothetical protein
MHPEGRILCRRLGSFWIEKHASLEENHQIDLSIALQEDLHRTYHVFQACKPHKTNKTLLDMIQRDLQRVFMGHLLVPPHHTLLGLAESRRTTECRTGIVKGV